jgi:hypothetical protein
VSYGLLEVIPSIKAAMEIKHNLLGFLWVQTPQNHPKRVSLVQDVVNKEIFDCLEL